jgi:hypothetical protein
VAPKGEEEAEGSTGEVEASDGDGVVDESPRCRLDEFDPSDGVLRFFVEVLRHSYLFTLFVTQDG